MLCNISHTSGQHLLISSPTFNVWLILTLLSASPHQSCSTTTHTTLTTQCPSALSFGMASTGPMCLNEPTWLFKFGHTMRGRGWRRLQSWLQMSGVSLFVLNCAYYWWLAAQLDGMATVAPQQMAAILPSAFLKWMVHTSKWSTYTQSIKCISMDEGFCGIEWSWGMLSYLSIYPFTPQNRLFLVRSQFSRNSPCCLPLNSPSPAPLLLPHWFNCPQGRPCHWTAELKCHAGHHNKKRFLSNSPCCPPLNSLSHYPHFCHINSIQFDCPQDHPCHQTTEQKCCAGHHNMKQPECNTTTPCCYNATTWHCDNTMCLHWASGMHGSTPQQCAAGTPLYYMTCIFHWWRGLYILFSSYSLYSVVTIRTYTTEFIYSYVY